MAASSASSTDHDDDEWWTQWLQWWADLEADWVHQDGAVVTAQPESAPSLNPHQPLRPQLSEAHWTHLRDLAWERLRHDCQFWAHRTGQHAAVHLDDLLGRLSLTDLRAHGQLAGLVAPLREAGVLPPDPAHPCRRGVKRARLAPSTTEHVPRLLRHVLNLAEGQAWRQHQSTLTALLLRLERQLTAVPELTYGEGVPDCGLPHVDLRAHPTLQGWEERTRGWWRQGGWARLQTQLTAWVEGLLGEAPEAVFEPERWDEAPSARAEATLVSQLQAQWHQHLPPLVIRGRAEQRERERDALRHALEALHCRWSALREVTAHLGSSERALEAFQQLLQQQLAQCAPRPVAARAELSPTLGQVYADVEAAVRWAVLLRQLEHEAPVDLATVHARQAELEAADERPVYDWLMTRFAEALGAPEAVAADTLHRTHEAARQALAEARQVYELELRDHSETHAAEVAEVWRLCTALERPLSTSAGARAAALLNPVYEAWRTLEAPRPSPHLRADWRGWEQQDCFTTLDQELERAQRQWTQGGGTLGDALRWLEVATRARLVTRALAPTGPAAPPPPVPW